MDSSGRDVSGGDSVGKGVAGGGGDSNVEEQLVMVSRQPFLRVLSTQCASYCVGVCVNVRESTVPSACLQHCRAN